MSGHSKWSTIKHKKAATDNVRGKLFSKLSRTIALACKEGGVDPEVNYKLRVAMEHARSSNMPKANIDRILEGAESRLESLEEIVYEGFGPYGVSVVVECTTDNKNRTSQEIKNMFERGGGSLAGPGSALFNFKQKGLIQLKNEAKLTDDQILKLIDLKVEDYEESDESVEIYVEPTILRETKEALVRLGFLVEGFSLVQKPVNLVSIEDEAKAIKVLDFLEDLEDHDDVLNVYANVDIPQEIINNLITRS